MRPPSSSLSSSTNDNEHNATKMRILGFQISGNHIESWILQIEGLGFHYTVERRKEDLLNFQNGFLLGTLKLVTVEITKLLF